MAASLLALRQPRPNLRSEIQDAEQVPAGERIPHQISLDRLRASGF